MGRSVTNCTRPFSLRDLALAIPRHPPIHPATSQIEL
ncbi:MAG: hypothetical protein BJ554DRAFT_4747 [Olpidium bornovanus]|uniref:Uncharacterized protein n=1 Tax=Olpidium bornovanus TaxID=278681 RepID=A0A8H7ZMJ4_9FUNG|nr:MAG: hypothetical protein BJ554DRAFT_4747 [Olpidium bornovanus]